MMIQFPFFPLRICVIYDCRERRKVSLKKLSWQKGKYSLFVLKWSLWLSLSCHTLLDIVWCVLFWYFGILIYSVVMYRGLEREVQSLADRLEELSAAIMSVQVCDIVWVGMWVSKWLIEWVSQWLNKWNWIRMLCVDIWIYRWFIIYSSSPVMYIVTIIYHCNRFIIYFQDNSESVEKGMKSFYIFTILHFVCLPT